MRCGIWITGCVLLVGLGARTGSAGEVPTLDVAADRVVALIAADDTAGLAKLAGAETPDPWRVAEALLHRGLLTQAHRFSEAVTGEGTASLAAYVEAAGVLGTAKTGGAVTRAVDAFEQGHVLYEASKLVAATASFDLAAIEAEAIGWWVFASECHYQAGLARHYDSDYQGARFRFERNLAAEKRLASGIGQGRGCYRIANAAMTLGDTDTAERYYKQARDLAGQGGDSYYLAKCHMDEGVRHTHAGLVKAGLAAFERAGALLERLDESAIPRRFHTEAGELALTRGRVLLNLASNHARQGHTKRARTLASRAMRAAREGGAHDILLSSRAFLATLEGAIAEAEGQPLNALAHYGRAAELYGRLGWVDEHADALRRLARVNARLADLPSALRDAQRAIDLLEPTGAKRKLCRAHIVAGDVCGSLARPDEAEAHHRKALRLAQEIGDPQLQIGALRALAARAIEGHETGRAMALLHEAQRLHAEHAGTMIAGVNLLIAEVHSVHGDHEGALKQAQRLIARPSVYGMESIALSARRLAGFCLWRLDRLDEALAHYDHVLRKYAAAGDRAAHIDVLYDLVAVYLTNRRYAEAKAAASRAVGLALASGDRSGEVHTRVLLGRALTWNGEDELALEELQYAREIAEDLESATLRSLTRAALAELYFFREQYDESIRHARAGVELGSTYGLSMSEASRAAARSTFSWCTRWGVASASVGDRGTDLYYFLERMRAMSVIASLGGRDRLRNAHVPRALRLAEDTAKAATALAYQQWLAAEQGGRLAKSRIARGRYEKALTRERDAVRAIQHAIREQAGLGDTAYGQPVELADAQTRLASDEALVLYGHDGRRYVAIVVRPGYAQTVRLGDVAVVDRAMAGLLEDPRSMGSSETLRKLLYGPLKLPASVKRVLISPAGKMAYVPFSALDQRRDLCMIPSVTAWVALGEMKVESSGKVLAVGDPKYGLRVQRPQVIASLDRGGPFGRLPATRKEVQQVGDTLLLGDEASETRLREVLSSKARWKAIHLACHGTVDDMMPTQSALVLASDEKNDGFLYADEIHDQIHISAELVVLSACSTGRGRIYGGEGLLGLSRAFMLAGAPRVLCSLWKVDDKATSALMAKFYEHWNPRAKPGDPERAQRVERVEVKGKSAATALRLAQEHVRSQKKWAHPYYWAAWVLWGLPD